MKDIEIQLVQKKTKTWFIKITRNKQPVNISGWTLGFTAKKLLTDPDSKAVILKDIVIANNTDSQNGRCYLSLTSAETNIPIDNYYYEVVFSAPNYCESFLRGKINVIPSVRQN